MAVTRAFKRSQGGAGDGVFLDADLDTSIVADTDDQIDIEIAGADDFTFTANDDLYYGIQFEGTGSESDTNTGDGLFDDSENLWGRKLLGIEIY